MAHYWTGGLSAPRPVQEIGPQGAAIEAPDVYYPGTVIRIALEDVTAQDDAAPANVYAGVWGQVLGQVNGGFYVAFLFESRAERIHFLRFLRQLELRGGNEVRGDKTE